MEKNIRLTGLSHFWEKAKAWISSEITKAANGLKTGLKLSDISDVKVTAAEVNHLDGVTGNVQEQLNAKAPKQSPQFSGVPTAPTASSGDNSQQIATTAYVKGELDSLKEEIKTSTVSVLKYKGTKETYEELPKENEKGDCWNVTQAHGNTPAGTNYAWDGEKWDPLGGDIDLSAYLTEDDLEYATDSEIDAVCFLD